MGALPQFARVFTILAPTVLFELALRWADLAVRRFAPRQLASIDADAAAQLAAIAPIRSDEDANAARAVVVAIREAMPKTAAAVARFHALATVEIMLMYAAGDSPLRVSVSSGGGNMSIVPHEGSRHEAAMRRAETACGYTHAIAVAAGCEAEALDAMGSDIEAAAPGVLALLVRPAGADAPAPPILRRRPGTVTIASADDVAALAAYDAIELDLVLEQGAPAEVALPRLLEIGGAIRVGPSSTVEALSFAALLHAGAIQVEGAMTKSVQLRSFLAPQLSSVKDQLVLRAPLQTMQLDRLARVGGKLVLSVGHMTSVALPALADVGGELGASGGFVEEIRLPSVVRVDGDLAIRWSSWLRSVDLRSLVSVRGQILLDRCPHLEELELASLAVARSVRVVECFRLDPGLASSLRDRGFKGDLDLRKAGTPDGAYAWACKLASSMLTWTGRQHIHFPVEHLECLLARWPQIDTAWDALLDIHRRDLDEERVEATLRRRAAAAAALGSPDAAALAATVRTFDGPRRPSTARARYAATLAAARREPGGRNERDGGRLQHSLHALSSSEWERALLHLSRRAFAVHLPLALELCGLPRLARRAEAIVEDHASDDPTIRAHLAEVIEEAREMLSSHKGVHLRASPSGQAASRALHLPGLGLRNDDRWSGVPERDSAVYRLGSAAAHAWAAAALAENRDQPGIERLRQMLSDDAAHELEQRLAYEDLDALFPSATREADRYIAAVRDAANLRTGVAGVARPRTIEDLRRREAEHAEESIGRARVYINEGRVRYARITLNAAVVESKVVPEAQALLDSLDDAEDR